MNRTCILIYCLVEYEGDRMNGGTVMNHEITFIHAADLHLDSPFKGLSHTPAHIFHEIKESTFLALDRLVEAAISKQVDFILISGDLFDNEKQSLKAQIRLKKAFERLEKQAINVYLSYGNHDYINGNIHKVTYPKNVYIFPDDVVRSFLFEKDGVPFASITGFSYVNRGVDVNKTSEYSIQYPEAAFHIAMLHGSLQGNTEHDTYAPFQLSELANHDFDYWALGHIHKRAVLKEDPPIIYPGNTQGRNRKETGEKGCYYVKLSKTNIEHSFIPLQAILFTPLTVDVSSCNKVFQLESIIQSSLEKQLEKSPQLIDLHLFAEHDALRTWHSSGELEEIIEIVNDTIINNNPWMQIFRISIEIKKEITDYEANYGEHFLAELADRFDGAVIQDYLQELYQHKQARKYLETPSQEEEQEIIKEARERLFDELVKGGR